MQLYFDREEQHQPGCHFYQLSQRSWTLGVRAILPKLLARSINLAFRTTYGAGRFGLFPKLEAVRIVNRFTSPAFAAIVSASSNARAQMARQNLRYEFTTYEDVDSFADNEIRPIFEALYTKLMRAFQSGKASGYDQDKDGQTLLHVSLIVPCTMSALLVTVV